MTGINCRGVTGTESVHFRDRGGDWGYSLIRQILMELPVCARHRFKNGRHSGKTKSLSSRDYILVEETNKNK